MCKCLACVERSLHPSSLFLVFIHISYVATLYHIIMKIQFYMPNIYIYIYKHIKNKKQIEYDQQCTHPLFKIIRNYQINLTKTYYFSLNVLTSLWTLFKIHFLQSASILFVKSSHSLQWGCWSWMVPAVSCTGAPCSQYLATYTKYKSLLSCSLWNKTYKPRPHANL